MNIIIIILFIILFYLIYDKINENFNNRILNITNNICDKSNCNIEEDNIIKINKINNYINKNINKNTSINTNINEIYAGINTNISEINTYPDIDLDIDLDIDQDTNQETNQDIDQDTNQDIDQDTNPDMNPDTNQDTNQDMNQETNQDMNQVTNQDMNQVTNQDMNQENNLKIEPETIYKNQILLNTTNPYLKIEKKLISNDKIDSSNCCLVTKKFNGDYYYDYQKMSGEKCNIDLYNLNKDKTLLFDGVNQWSNDYCNTISTKSYLGSCRNKNFECFDFVNENQCIDYKNAESKGLSDFLNFNEKISLRNRNNIVWSEKTCEERLEYIPPNIIPYINNIQ
jgi:hypothetical protein